MKDYVKPVVCVSDCASEGVYTASGEDCYTVGAYIHQTPETGRGDYRIQVNGVHAASDGHHSGEQVLTLSFNQPVTYGNTTASSISITYNYHNNANDNIGLGDVVVQSEPGLALLGATLTCNHDCGQH